MNATRIRLGVVPARARTTCELWEATRLLKDDPRPYQQIIVAGHSLGSVIAYDVLNEVMNRRLATTDPVVAAVPARGEIHQNDLDKIKGLTNHVRLTTGQSGVFLSRVRAARAERARPDQLLLALLQKTPFIIERLWHLQTAALLGR